MDHQVKKNKVPETGAFANELDGRQKWRCSLRELVLSGGCAQETPRFHEQIGAEGHSESEYVHPAPCIWRWRGEERHFWRKNGSMAREHSEPALVSSQTAQTGAPRAARLPGSTTSSQASPYICRASVPCCYVPPPGGSVGVLHLYRGTSLIRRRGARMCSQKHRFA